MPRTHLLAAAAIASAAALAPARGPNVLESFLGIGLDGSPWQYMLTLRRKGYDGVAKVPLGPAGDYYFLLSPEAVKTVVLEEADVWPKRYSVPLFETLKLDRGIVYENNGERHRRQKKLCVPAFEKGASMQTFLAAFTEEASTLAAEWRAGERNGATRVDLYAEMRRLTLRVVLRVTFGLDLARSTYSNAQELSEIIGKYLETIVATANEIPPLYQIYPPLSRNYVRVTEQLLPRLRELVAELIDLRRGELADGGDAGADLLSLLLRESALDDDDILYVLFDLVIAGSDTTASTLAASLFLLYEPRHAKCLDRALSEAQSVDLDSITLEEVRAKLPYSVAVARETLRLYPPVPFVGRTASRATAVAGAAVPEKAVACFSPYYLGRDPERWADADAFRPERWLDSATGGADSTFSWLPFGAGPRGCLGTRLGLTEATVGIARVLREFDVAFDRAGKEISYTYDLTLNLGTSTTCELRPR